MAYIQVPMDWLNPSDRKRVVLGVIKLPAKSKNNKVSPLFINPGVWFFFSCLSYILTCDTRVLEVQESPL